VIKHLPKTKLLIALVAVGAVGLVLVGLASAQIAAYQSFTTNPTDATNSGFWGWIGNCFGYTTNKPYASTQHNKQLLISQFPLPTNNIKMALDTAMVHVGQDN